jgi:hypothetical protein
MQVLERLESEISQWPHITSHLHRFGGRESCRRRGDTSAPNRSSDFVITDMHTSLMGCFCRRFRTASFASWYLCPACSVALRLALLHWQIFDPLHEIRRCNRTVSEVGNPIKRPGRQDHFVSFPAYEHFLCAELEFLWQPDGLTAIVHKDFRFALHGRRRVHGSLWHIRWYMPKFRCAPVR